MRGCRNKTDSVLTVRGSRITVCAGMSNAILAATESRIISTNSVYSMEKSPELYLALFLWHFCESAQFANEIYIR